jgi:hypothetical protein
LPKAQGSLPLVNQHDSQTGFHGYSCHRQARNAYRCLNYRILGGKIQEEWNLADTPGLSMVAKGFIGERVEFPSFCVSLDLAIPCSCIKLGEPPPKLCEFLSRESGDFLLEGFKFAHRRNVTTSPLAE